MLHRQVIVPKSYLQRTDTPNAASPIFGSVTASDILKEIKKALGQDDEASSIQFEEDDVVIKAAQEGRIKHLGIYEVSLPLKVDKSIAFELSVEVRSADENAADSRLMEQAQEIQKPVDS